MKRILKVLALIITGFVIGFFLSGLNSFRVISMFAGIALSEMAIDVRQLQQGRSDEVLERKRGALPGTVLSFESSYSRFLPESQRNGILWAVSRCYEGQESGPPESIKHILDALPPRPLTSCEIKRRAAEKNGSAVEPCTPTEAGK